MHDRGVGGIAFAVETALVFAWLVADVGSGDAKVAPPSELGAPLSTAPEFD